MDDQSRPATPTPEQIEEAIRLLWGALHRGSPPPPRVSVEPFALQVHRRWGKATAIRALQERVAAGRVFVPLPTLADLFSPSWGDLPEPRLADLFPALRKRK